MQVSQVEDHITHAVLSGNKAIEFKMSNSAAFAHILSSTLYTNPMLAVVREVACNAWDAHIDAGITDRVIEITLTEDKLTFRDFGKGIAPDQMGAIYGTYGASTKLNDGEQTGGFGLGCKSPFAYDDHFEVISHHAGFKTIYRLSKSSAELGGLPTITPILTVPSVETGLQVSLSLKEKYHFQAFKHNIESIVFNGEIFAKLNGEDLLTLPMSKAVNGYIITHTLLNIEAKGIRNSNRIFIRYGNVIYPIPVNTQYADAFRSTENLLGSVNSSAYPELKIIFQAPPHSISVTPSREALSMQSHTVNTVSKLLSSFDPYKGSNLKQKFYDALDRQIKKTAEEQNWSSLLRGDESVPGSKPTNRDQLPFITTDEEFIEETIMYRYPLIDGFVEKDMLGRLDALNKAGIVDRGLARKFRAGVRKYKGHNKKHKRKPSLFISSWYKREIFSPLLKALMKEGMPIKKALFLRMYNYYSSTDFYADNIFVGSMWKLMPFLQKRIILTTSSEISDKLEKRLHSFPGWVEASDRLSCFVYTVSRKKEEIEKARNLFKRLGYEITDLTYRHDWEPEPVKRTISSVPRKARSKGYIALSAAKVNNSYLESNLIREDAPRIENPEYYYKFSQSKTPNHVKIPGFDYTITKTVVDLIGDKGAAIYTSAQREKVVVDGIPYIQEYLLGKVYDKMLEPQFLNYWSTDPVHCASISDRRIYYTDLKDLTYILNISEIRNKLGLSGTLSIEDKKYLKIFNELRLSGGYIQTVPASDKKVLVSVEKELVNISKDTAIQGMIEKIKLKNIFNVVRLNEVPGALKRIRDTKSQVALDQLIDILVLTLKT